MYKTFPSWKTQTTNAVTTSVKPTLFQETLRRDGIIKKLVASCPYKAGDKVKPKEDKAFADHGICEVEAIVDNYTKFGKAEVWPEHDNPMIVHLFSPKMNNRFIATTNWAEKC